MAKQKFYAVRRGLETGIFTSWEECKKNVYGFSNPEYKSFLTLDEAKRFMDNVADDCEDTPREGAVVAYVDGSYKADTKEFSYGAVIFISGNEIEMCKSYNKAEYAELRNVAGEIVGAGKVMEYCIENGIDKLDLYHDYTGIAKWCTGEWKATKTVTKRYKEFYDSIKDKLDVRFVIVKGHSGNEYNDRADALAKSALGI